MSAELVHLLAPEDPRTDSALDVLAELRNHIERAELAARYRAASAEGYRLAAVFVGQDCRAVAGFRISHNTALGRNCYVDDLVTTGAHRSEGHGRTLHDWLLAHASAAGCTTLHLDSGTQRVDAHWFYVREGHVISSFHFSQPLGPT